MVLTYEQFLVWRERVYCVSKKFNGLRGEKLED